MLVFLNKILLFTFIFCCLILIKELFLFVKGVVKGEYEITKNRTIVLGLAISFIITVLITGFTLL